MDWAKVDAALAAELDGDDGTGRFLVLVHLSADCAVTPNGLTGGDGAIRTASLPAAEIGRLTELAEVRQVRLSRRLGLAGDG